MLFAAFADKAAVVMTRKGMPASSRGYSRLLALKHFRRRRNHAGDSDAAAGAIDHSGTPALASPSMNTSP